MKISQLRIKNYRSIKDTGVLYPTKLFALIGKNNSGKSTVGRALQAFWGDSEATIVLDDFHKGGSDNIEIQITLTDFVEDREEKYLSENGDMTIDLECEKGKSPTYKINGSKVPATAMKKDVLPELLVIPAIRNPENESTAGAKSYLKQLISLILKEQEKVDVEEGLSIDALGKKKLEDVSEEEIKIFLESRRKNEIERLSVNVNVNFQNILSDTKKTVEILPKGDLSKFYTEYSTKIKDEVLSEHMADGVNILSCGTGLQSIYILSLLQTYADMRKCNDSILLIEEPEVYLHPDFQRKMFAALRGIAKDNQVIYTTHSPIMIGELWADDSVRLVTLKEGQTSIETIKIESVISELGIRYEDVLNPNLIAFVEGKTDAEFFEYLMLMINPKLEKTLPSIVKFIPSDGYRSIDSYAYMKIINSQNVDADFCVIADSDGVDPESRKKWLVEEIKKKIGSIKKDDELLSRITILGRYAIESYLLDADILHEAFSGIEKKSLTEMITLYETKYLASLEDVQQGKMKLQEFQRYFTPKNLFNNDIKKHSSKFEKFSSIFDNTKEFLETRELLASGCEDVRRKGESIIHFVLSKAKADSDILKEPIQVVRDILERAERK